MRTATPLDQPRAMGRAVLRVKPGNRGTFIDRLRQEGSLKLLFPRQRDRVEAILVNTAGGVTGGDRFDFEATAGPGTRLSVTTQAAERGYRAHPGQTGQVRTRLRVHQGGTLFWLPQETILYDHAAFDRALDVALDPTATFLMVEPVLFGRGAMGERLNRLDFDDRVCIRCGDTPVYRDGISLHGRVAETLDRPAVADGARAMASLVWHAPQACGRLDAARDILGLAGGATMLAETLMAMRLLAPDGFELRRRLLPLLDLLTNNSLPQSWRL